MRLRRQLNLAIYSLCSVVILVGCGRAKTFDAVNVAQERAAPVVSAVRAPSPIAAADGAILFSRWLAAVQWASIVAFAEAAAVMVVTSKDRPSAVVSVVPSTDDGFLACTRAHESDTAGGYGAVSPSGTYRGAYQFDRSTWDSAAQIAGRADLVGADPATVEVGAQDQVALALYGARGNQPWGGRC